MGKRVHAGQQTKDIWHPVYSLQSRLDWVRRRRDKLGPQFADKLEADLSQRMVAVLEDRYWRRQFKDFNRIRRLVGDACPDAMRQSFLWNKKIHPRWVYKLRDLLSRG